MQPKLADELAVLGIIVLLALNSNLRLHWLRPAPSPSTAAASGDATAQELRDAFLAGARGMEHVVGSAIVNGADLGLGF